MTKPVIVWFRLDLRINDNPALTAAKKQGAPVVPVYIWSPDEEKHWQPGAASRYWLHYALQDLREELASLNSELIIVKGSCLESLKALVNETGADTIFWNRCYEPLAIERDRKISEYFSNSGFNVRNFNAGLLHEPQQIRNKQGLPYRVYTPFWKNYQTQEIPTPIKDSRAKLECPVKWPQSLKLETLQLVPEKDWHKGIFDSWDMTARGGKKRIQKFLREAIHDYHKDRDYPAIDGVSKLSPYLHFGQIGARQIWHWVNEAGQQEGKLTPGKSVQTYLSQLVWREFAYHILFHFPETTEHPMNKKFKVFPWKKNRHHLRCWQQGNTGYPIVDAGMRQLWQTGWMHNRVRMIAASFLTKNLMLHWLEGARWFWDTLVDADLANNTMGWQWIAGSGVDAAPYFRIFNPVRQSERFDPEGEYIRRWIPELEGLDRKYIHAPWEAPDAIKKVINYPAPLVDHNKTRKQALACYDQIKSL